MQLHDVHEGIHRRKKRKRVGRGVGSGHGKTSSKGHKGHSSRQGFKIGALFEGGQITLARRVPRRGFFNGSVKTHFATVNLVDIDAVFTQAGVVDEAALRSVGLVKGYDYDGIKILADGEVTKAFEIRATKFSGAAVKKLEAAGGKAVEVPYVGKVKKDETAPEAPTS